MIPIAKLSSSVERGTKDALDRMIAILEEREKEKQFQEVQFPVWKKQMVKPVQQEVAATLQKQSLQVHVAEMSWDDHLSIFDQARDRSPKHIAVDMDSGGDAEKERQRQQLGLSHSEGAVPYHFRGLQGSRLLFQDGEKQVSFSPRQIPLDLQTRGKLNALEFIEQMKPQEMQKTWRRAEQVAERQGQPPQKICKQMMQQKLAAYEQKQRLQLLQTGQHLQRELPKLRAAVREIDQVIAGHQERLRGMSAAVRQQPAFVQTWEALQTKQEHGKSLVAQYELMQQGLHIEMKLDLQAQFPELNLQELTFEETLSLEQAASQMTRGGVPALEKQMKKSRDLEGAKALEKAKQPLAEHERDRSIEREALVVEEITIEEIHINKT